MLVFYTTYIVIISMFLFGKRTKKFIQKAFVVIGILVIVSMIALYFPTLYR